MTECVKCRDWGKYETHADHWPPASESPHD
ncbi:hypothetical protein SAMN05428970_1995 [Agromyces sp. CF514]|nr:hypothetical protein SAMN05428970_1995 [Agromyces sp. CF514]